MFKQKHNHKLKNTKFESSDNAIKRGVMVQTSFLSKREGKAKLKADEVSDVPRNIGGDDCYDADSYHQMQLIKFIQAKA